MPVVREILSNKIFRIILVSVIAIQGVFLYTNVYAEGTTDLEWVTQYGSTQFDLGIAVLATESGVYTGGLTEGSLPGFNNLGIFDGFVSKHDESGNLIWIVKFG